MSDYWLFTGPRTLRWPVWLLDELLDRVPTYEDGQWFRKGGWGCRLLLARWWDEDIRRERGDYVA